MPVLGDSKPRTHTTWGSRRATSSALSMTVSTTPFATACF
jgi:hypothetical protein